MEQIELVQLGISHWLYVFTVVTIIISIIFRRDVIIPSLIGLFLIGFFTETPHVGLVNNIIFSVQVIFDGLLNAGKQLFNIMLVIAIMVALLSALRQQGADRLMVEPMKKLMIGPWSAFFVLGISMYIAAIFFWPTPSIALVGTVLLPVAVQMGLPAMAAAVSVNLFGHGMALSADPVIQGANRLTATAAGIGTEEVLPYAFLFSTVTGVVAIAIALYTLKRDMKNGKLPAPAPTALSSTDTNTATRPVALRGARCFALLVPLVLLCIVVLMIYRALFAPESAIRGGAATALLGGSAALLLILTCMVSQGKQCLENITLHIREGFMFAVKIFAPVIPIAGFFFLGHPKQAEAVIGAGASGYLFDIGNNIGYFIDGSKFLLTSGIAFIGILSGLDGSGFSGLPLVGSLSAALTSGTELNPGVLAAVGQVAAVFAGGGTLTAWAFGMAADAGIAGVNPAELARRNFVPVIAGLLVSSLLAVYLI
ncbi:hypothetical protein ACBP46_01015 [Paenalcaligenes hominis]|uniref:hypothetical protein n=1 Tax=Paenalcaligenes hominis TaxID=643674 RepID=UPI003524D2ED